MKRERWEWTDQVKLLQWSLLQAETVSHMLSPNIYPFQSIWMQMNVTMCLNKCPRERKHLLEMSLPFLSKIGRICSPSQEKEKSLTSSNFSSHIDSNILRFWTRSRSTAWKRTLILETSEGIAAWRRPVCRSSSSIWQYWLISLEDTLPGIWSPLYLENVLLCYIYTANSKQPSMYTHMVHPKAYNLYPQFHIV